MEEFGADPAVETDAAGDVLDLGADLLAQIGDFVDEGDLGRKKGVGRIFDQLGSAPRRDHQRRLVEIERPIDFAHDLGGAVVLRADHDPVRMLEILDRCALAEEFRVRHYPDIGPWRDVAQDPLDLVAGADRHGRLVTPPRPFNPADFRAAP